MWMNKSHGQSGRRLGPRSSSRACLQSACLALSRRESFVLRLCLILALVDGVISAWLSLFPFFFFSLIIIIFYCFTCTGRKGEEGRVRISGIPIVWAPPPHDWRGYRWALEARCPYPSFTLALWLHVFCLSIFVCVTLSIHLGRSLRHIHTEAL